MDSEFGNPLRLHRGEPWIFQSGAGSAANDGLSERFICFNDADTPLETFAQVKRHKDAAALGKDSFTRKDFRKLAVRYGFDNGRTGQLQRGTAVRIREGRHPRTSCGLRACGAGAAA